MNEAEIERCKQQLIALRAQLGDLEKSFREEAGSADPDHAGIGRFSRADAMQALKAAEEGPRLRKRQSQKIDGALRRIESGEYGRCFVCEAEIDARRLLADPTITRCTNCVEP